MLKKLNMLVLIVLLITQTMIAPIAATALGVVELEGAETTEDLEEVTNEEDVDQAVIEEIQTPGTDDEEVEKEVIDTEEDTGEEEPKSGVTNEEKQDKGRIAEHNNEEEAISDVIDEEKEKIDSDKESNETAEVEGHGFNLNIGGVTDLNDNPYGEGNLLNPSDQFRLKLDWNLEDGHGYVAGDTEIFDLPKGIKITQEITGELRDEFNEILATYTITPDKKVELTFTDFVEGHSTVKGWLEIILLLDEVEVEVEDGEAIINPIGEEGELRIPIEQGNKEKTIEKNGTPNKGYNADEINWEVIINKHKTSLKDVKVTDLLPEGTEYKEGSLKVTKLKVDLHGNILGDGEEVSVTGETEVEGTLIIPLGDIKDAYRVEYVTTVLDDEAKQFKNRATISDDELDDVSAESTITINRGEAIEKKAAKGYDPKTGIIEWEIDFNYNEKDLTDVTLTDGWTPIDKIDLVEGSLVFTEVKIDENGNAQETSNIGLPDGAELVQGTDQFEVTGITTDKAYKVTYQTKVKDRVLDGFEVSNTAGFGSESVGSGTGVGTYYGSKSAGTIDYAAKTIDWKIEMNHDEFPMEKISIADTLGEGLTLIDDSIKITVGGEDYTDFTLVEGNPFEIIFADDYITNKKIEVFYKTSFDAGDMPDNRATNKASITWTPEGEEESITKEVEAGTDLNNNTKNNDWKNGSYDPATKEITWTIYTNYRENKIDNLIVKDAPVGNQKIVADSVVVRELTIGGNGNITEGEPLDPHGATVTEEANTMEVNIGDTDKAYKIEYRTSLAGLSDIQSEYVNKAEVLDGTENLSDLEAKVGITKSDTYGEKSGYQEGKQVHWSVKVNLGQQKINNLKLEDTISETQDYLVDTIKVYHATVDGNGNAARGDEVPADEYEVTHTQGERTFTVDWHNEIERAFIVEYSTLFFEQHGQDVTNTYKVTGDSILEEDNNSEGGSKVTISQLSSGGGSGEAGYLIIDKIGKKDGNEAPLAGAEFDLIDPDTKKVLKSGTTDEDGHIDFGRLLFGIYELHERVVPDGYVTQEETQTIEINKKYEKDDDKETFAYQVLNFEPVFAVELYKTDDENNALAGAEFTLFDSEDDEIATETTNAEGKILFEGLENAGTYYVQETKAPDGYVLNTDKHTVTIGDKEPGPIELTVDNTPRGAVQLTKTDVDTEEPLEGVEFELQKKSDSEEYEKVETDEPLITDENGIITTSNTLEAGSYQFVETKSLGGYRTNAEPVQFEVYVNDANTQSFTMTNEKFKGSVKLIKSDAATDALLAGAVFKLVDSEGELVKENLVTNDQGEINIEDLLLGEYQLIETKAPAGYELDEKPIDVEITEDLQVVEKTMPNNKITDISVEKKWNNAGGETVPVTVKLLPTDLTAELNEDNDWEVAFKDLHVYDESGEEVDYQVEEVAIDNYESTVTGDSETGFIVTNTELTTVSGGKIWLDDLDEHPTITVELLANGTKVDEIEVNAASDWNYEFTNLVKYDESGEAITYTVDEVEVDGYKTTINGFDITNLRVGTIELSGEKVWLDDNSEDRPESITVQLLANEEVFDSVGVNADSNWTYEFSGLDQYDDQGIEITYSVDEEDVFDDYEKSIEGNAITNLRVGTTEVDVIKSWQDEDETDRPDTININLLQNGDFYKGYEVLKENDWELTITDLPQYDKEGKAYEYTITEHDVAGYEADVDGFEITNTRTDVKTIEITKSWLDYESTSRPDVIEVDLFRSTTDGDKELVDTYEVTGSADATNWSLEIKDLPSFDNDGKAYTYEINEKEVDGYEVSINGFDLTNLRVGTTELSGEKIWLDDNSEDRPESITVQLLANEEVFDSVEVNADSNWAYEFTDLDQYDDQGIEITYSVDEEDVFDDYEKSIEGNDITNVRVGTTEVVGTKTWLDNDSKDRPESITVQLLVNGDQVDEVEVTSETDWTYVFTDLAAYDAEGKAIEFTINELKVDGYETEINGYDLTNTLIPVEPKEPTDPKEPTEVEKPAVWKKDPGKDEEGSRLSNTATNIFNLSLIGFGLILVGLILSFVGRKRFI